MGRTMRRLILLQLCLFLFATVAHAIKTKPPRVATASEAYRIEEDLQLTAALNAFREDLHRAYALTLPLLIEAAKMEGAKTTYSLGCLVSNRHLYKIWLGGANRPTFPIAERELGLSKYPQVEYVIPNLSEDEDGLLVGDRLLKLGNKRFPNGSGVETSLRGFLRRQCKNKETVELTILRRGEERAIHLRPIVVLDSRLVVKDAYTLQAAADGKVIYISRGLLSFTNDQEASFIIGHEIAHNLMLHVQSARAGAYIGSVFDVAASIYGVNTGGAFSQVGRLVGSAKREAEADYISLYLLARAGMEYEGAPAFWRKLSTAILPSHQQGFLRSHPTHSERFLSMDAIIEEIRRKKKSGEELRPTYKGDKKQEQDLE